MNDVFAKIATAHNNAIKRGILNSWTIYNSPVDYPGVFVARRFEVGGKTSDPTVTDDVVEGQLQALRECFKHCGLICFPRQKQDPPQIVETWM